MWEALAYWRNREKARVGGVLNDEGRMVCEEATGVRAAGPPAMAKTSMFTPRSSRV